MKKSLFAIGIIGLAALVLGAQYGSMDVLGILKVNTIQKLTGGTAVYVEGVYMSGGQIGAATDRPSAYINNLNVTGTVTGISGSGDVVGPASSAAGNFMSFSDTSGKVAADSGKKSSDFAAASHTHDGTYEPVISTKNTGFNLNTGTTSGTLATGDHAHTGVYEAANANIQSHISSTSNPHSVTAAQVSAVATSGNETVAGVKTFSSSPIVPTPTTDYQAATKKYVDDNAGGGSGGGGLSAAQAKTADYSVVAADANKLTYLSKATVAAKVFSLPAAADVSNKSFTFANLCAYALRLRVAGQSDICTGGTPAASTGTAANAFDGSTSTSCDFTATTGTLSYDFGSGVTKAVNRLRMYCDGNNGSIATFQIQYSSDGSTWYTAFSQSEALAWAAAGWQDCYFKNDAAYRYWRVNILTTKGAANGKIFEVEMFDQCIQDGLSEKVLYKGESVNVFCDGSNFIIY